ncbi:hypothetical protein DM02DRAFT_407116 [Periconia macrospinosa]|uniref:Uncharacterized protein n=1 Tax=Periconia macrospinosa TaxID=97972 RepID=A0A2V1E898_9PLEO|nr:hypothetical protein DM02DRAFT_407116 [Periconia macrospinosa]
MVSLRRAHNLRTDSHRDTSPHNLRRRRLVFWTLSFLMPNADVSHARPLQAVVPHSRGEAVEEVEDYSEFLICMVRRLEVNPSVCL